MSAKRLLFGTDEVVAPILGIAFFGFGLLFLYLSGQVTTLRCERVSSDRVDCARIVTWMQLTKLREQAIPRIESTTVQESCDDDGCTYRVLLISRYGDIPMTNVWSSGENYHRSQSQQINKFIRDPNEQTLEITSGGGFWIVVPLFFVGLGMIMLVGNLITRFRGETIT